MKLTDVLQNVYQELGFTRSFIATGGSTTTVLDANSTNLESPPEDNFAVDWSLFVRRDSAGAGAAPHGQFSIVSAYTASGGTFTLRTALTAAVASGDEIILANKEIPLRTAVWAVNRALEEIGPLPKVADTSLTSVNDQWEYTLPAAVQAGVVRDVFYQGATDNANRNLWTRIPWEVEQGTYGSTGTLIVRYVPAGRTIKIIYDGIHGTLNDFDDEIAESVPRKLIMSAATFFALRWYNGRNDFTEQEWVQRYAEAGQDMDRFMSKLRRPPKQIQGMPQWDDVPRYPGDPDVLL